MGSDDIVLEFRDGGKITISISGDGAEIFLRDIDEEIEAVVAADVDELVAVCRRVLYELDTD